MIIGTPLINGIEYTHTNIVLNIMGFPIAGVTAIDYGDPQQMTLNYGAAGSLPVSRGFGIVEPFASITLTFQEVQRISDIAPGGRIQNIPAFDIGINYIIEEELKFVRHKLLRVKFKGRNPNSQVNNSQIEERLELSVGDIKYK